MQTIRERAQKLAKLLCIDGTYPELANNYEYDIECIITVLEEQDRITRHAIDEEVSRKSKSVCCFDTQEAMWNGVRFLTELEVHSIVMNTRNIL